MNLPLNAKYRSDIYVTYKFRTVIILTYVQESSLYVLFNRKIYLSCSTEKQTFPSDIEKVTQKGTTAILFSDTSYLDMCNVFLDWVFLIILN